MELKVPWSRWHWRQWQSFASSGFPWNSKETVKMICYKTSGSSIIKLAGYRPFLHQNSLTGCSLEVDPTALQSNQLTSCTSVQTHYVRTSTSTSREAYLFRKSSTLTRYGLAPCPSSVRESILDQAMVCVLVCRRAYPRQLVVILVGFQVWDLVTSVWRQKWSDCFASAWTYFHWTFLTTTARYIFIHI